MTPVPAPASAAELKADALQGALAERTVLAYVEEPIEPSDRPGKPFRLPETAYQVDAMLLVRLDEYTCHLGRLDNRWCLRRDHDDLHPR